MLRRPAGRDTTGCRSRRRVDRGQATVIAAPRAVLGAARLMRDGGRLWGTTAQIYSLRQARNFGIGDYTDVAELAAEQPPRSAPRSWA